MLGNKNTNSRYVRPRCRIKCRIITKTFGDPKRSKQIVELGNEHSYARNGGPYNSAVKVRRRQAVELPRVWSAGLHPPRTFDYYHYLPGCFAVRAITFPLLYSCAWRWNDCFCLPKGSSFSTLTRPFAFNYRASWNSFEMNGTEERRQD